ncbi:MAG: clostripain-related cysteine peptidase [Promethearchaeota archaeon]
MNARKTAFLFLFILIFSLMAFMPQLSNLTSEQEQNMSMDPVSMRNGMTKQTTKDWTFLIYVAADNNLVEPGEEEINEIEDASLNLDDINVIALVDTEDRAFLYNIQPDTNTSEINSPLLLDSTLAEEPNMGAGQTLRTFVEYGFTNFPAERYALILWDHGLGFYGICWDESSEDDRLTLGEVQEYLNGYHFDLLICVACLMGQIEVAYEWRNLADYIIFSEEVISISGFPFKEIFNRISNNPFMSTEAFIQGITTDFIASYSPGGIYSERDDVTISAINTTNITDLVTKLDGLAVELLKNISSSIDLSVQVALAKFASEYFYYHSFIDIGDFMENLKLRLNTNYSHIIDAADEVLASLPNAVFIHKHYSGSQPTHPDETGLSIYLRDMRLNSTHAHLPDYTTLEFCKDTQWDEFVEIYMNTTKIPEITAINLDPEFITPKTDVNVYFQVDKGEFEINSTAVLYRDYFLPYSVSATLVNQTGDLEWYVGTIPAIPKGGGRDLEIICTVTNQLGYTAQTAPMIVPIQMTEFDPFIDITVISPDNVTEFTDIAVKFHVLGNDTIVGTKVLYKDFLRWHAVVATQINGTDLEGWWAATIPAISKGTGHILRIQAQATDQVGRTGRGITIVRVIGGLTIPSPGFTIELILLIIPGIIVLIWIRKKRKIS